MKKKQTTNKEPEFMSTDVRYCVEVDYERTTPEPDDDYGRHTTIYDEHVTDIDVNAVIEKIAKSYISITCSKLNRYIFDRLCILNEVYNPVNYTIETVNGYYGEEVGKVTFDKEESVLNLFWEINCLPTDASKIKRLLQLEYGFVPEYINKYTHVVIYSINPKHVIIPQERYWQKIKDEDQRYMSNYALPRGICITDDEVHFSLIDGYHRVSNAINRNLPSIDIIALK